MRRRAARRSAIAGTTPRDLLHRSVRIEWGRVGALEAQVFARGQYPALGRFNLGTPDSDAADATVRVRGIGLRISTPDGQEWRSAMINAPVFAVSTPREFYDLLIASASKDPDVMKAFRRRGSRVCRFRRLGRDRPLDGQLRGRPVQRPQRFPLRRRCRREQAVRWSLLPAAQPVPVSPEDLVERGPDFLDPEITERVGGGPQRWTLVVTVANPDDPTADPTKAWPEDRRTVEVGTLIVQKIEAEPDGPCRDINFDPTVLPTGIRVSDDPFPAARSAAYAKSYDLRTAEAKDYPRTGTSAKP